ncbi:tetratricopeptide repeat protein [Phreatobacter stygius]|uniref:Sel1 repeat family protein n=1 Tax=Phreatobacter stygius TaxID=1940610 RepID=A0A4D7BE99_9HYPH|nr:tetratricopeptide repeat protein [Phreatobacter stygius]QCI68803.1 sel1 repeat family protein [Phreatobacter stygius]
MSETSRVRAFLFALAVAASPVGATGAFAFDGQTTTDPRSPLDAFRAGGRALRDGRTEEAVSSLQYAASNGHAASAWKLGRMYMAGDGVAQNDLKAFETFRRITIERGDESPNSPDAQFISAAFVTMGNYWLEGIPNTYVRANPQRAFELYFYAASTFGDADGQFRLGRLFLEGQGTPRDPRQAARWLSLAAGKSHYKAQAVLGHMLFAGRDVPRQAPRGLMFLTLAKEAASETDTWVTEMYEEAMRTASDDERGVALRMVEAWLKTSGRR